MNAIHKPQFGADQIEKIQKSPPQKVRVVLFLLKERAKNSCCGYSNNAEFYNDS